MTERLPVAVVVHAMSGRTRLRIAERRGDRAFFASIATGLSAMPGVSRVEARPLTGSILILHVTPFARVAAAAERARLFAVGDASIPLSLPATAIDAKKAAAASLGVFALWQLSRGQILPPALTLVWYAASLTDLWSNVDASTDGE